MKPFKNMRTGNYEEGPGSRSIKTRIETRIQYKKRGDLPIVREADPLKQGLKLFMLVVSPVVITCPGSRSIKTRIETNCGSNNLEEIEKSGKQIH